MANLSAVLDAPVRAPSVLPPEWEWVGLTDICRPRQWPTISRKDLLPTGYVVYGANGPIGYYSEFTHTDPTIAVTCRGATCGTVNLVPARSYITGNAMALDALDSTRVTQPYLYHALRYRGLADVVSGSAQPQITRQGLTPLQFPLPPLPEQRKIAAILTAVDETIEKTGAVIEQLGVVKKAMMQELLTRGLPGRHTRFKKTEIGEIPEEWEVAKLESITTRVTDGEHKTPLRTPSGVLLLSARNIQNGKLRLDTVDYVGEDEYERIARRCRPEANDVLISCSGTIGRVCRVPSGLRFGLVRSVALVKPRRDKIDPVFLEFALRSKPLQIQMENAKKQAAQANLFQGPIRSLLVPIPPIDEQRELASLLALFDAREEHERACRDALASTKSALMSVLLTGELRVAPDEDAA